MFEGGGFGVGLTVQQLDAPPWPSAELVPADGDWHPTRLGELMPVAARSDAELAEEMRRANITDSRLWAYRVEMIVQLAERRRDDRDRPVGTPGAASPAWAGSGPVPEGVSEFFPDELALILNCSRAEATKLTAVASTLVHRLPETWAALADGELNWSRACAIATEINRVRVRRRSAPAGHGRGSRPPAGRRPSRQPCAGAGPRRSRPTRRGGNRAPEEAGRDRRRRVSALFHPRGDGGGRHRPPAAGSCRDVCVGGRACQTGQDGRRSTSDRAGPCRVDGRPDAPPVGRQSTGSHRRATGARAAELLAARSRGSRSRRRAIRYRRGRGGVGHRGAPEGTPHRPRCRVPRRSASTYRRFAAPGSARRRRRVARNAHASRAGAGGAPRLSGTLRGRLPMSGGDTACAEPGVCTHRGTAPLGGGPRRTCRHPGCRTKAGWADLDHVVAHADGGPTDCDNLCCLCRRHHRLKTHAPGWSFRLDADGALLVTTPSGVTRVSRPPGAELLEPYELGAPLPDAELVDLVPF